MTFLFVVIVYYLKKCKFDGACFAEFMLENGELSSIMGNRGTEYLCFFDGSMLPGW